MDTNNENEGILHEVGAYNAGHILSLYACNIQMYESALFKKVSYSLFCAFLPFLRFFCPVLFCSFLKKSSSFFHPLMFGLQCLLLAHFA